MYLEVVSRSCISELYLGVKEEEGVSQGRAQHNEHVRRSIENLCCMIVASGLRDTRTTGGVVAVQYTGCPNGWL